MRKNKKFSDVVNTYSPSVIEKAKALGYIGKWWVSEKIHGCNLGVFYEKATRDIFYATRDDLLTPESEFYNYLDVMAKIKPNFDKLIKNLRSLFGDFFDQFHTVVVYGEIFGGSYPHPDVVANPNAERVQKGVFYSPSNQFAAFDVGLLRERTPEELKALNDRRKVWGDKLSAETSETRIGEIKSVIGDIDSKINQPEIYYLGFQEFVSALSDTGFLKVPFIGVYDTLDEALAVNPVFESSVYQEYGLPKIDGNFAEGLVIRPCQEVRFRNDTRVIFKNKNPKFAENVRNGAKKEPKVEPTYSEDTNNLISKATEYSNENRLNAVVSKMAGPFTDKDFGKILAALNADLFKDLEKDFPEEVGKVKDLNEWKGFQKVISKVNTDLLKEKFKEIIG